MSMIVFYKSLLLICGVIHLLNIVIVTNREPNTMQKYTLCVDFLSAFYIFGNYLALSASVSDMLFVGIKMMYLSIILLAVFFLRLMENELRLHFPRILWSLSDMMSFVFIVFVLALNNSSLRIFETMSHMWYKSFEITKGTDGSLDIVNARYGIMMYIFICYVALYSIYSFVLFIYRIVTSRNQERRNYITLLFYLFAPVIVYGLSNINIHTDGTPIYRVPVFPVIMSISISVNTIFLIVKRYNTFLDRALYELENSAATPIFILNDSLEVRRVSRSACVLFPEYKALYRHKQDRVKANTVLQNIIFPSDEDKKKDSILIKHKKYNPTLRVIRASGKNIGYIIMLRDITKTQNAFMEAVQKNEELAKLTSDYEEKCLTMKRKFVSGVIQVGLSINRKTGEHLRRISNYTLAIAREMQNNQNYKDVLTDEYVEMLSMVSPLHDVGMLFLEKDLMAREGGYTRSELEQLHTHIKRGLSILESFLVANKDDLFYNLTVEVVENHHEWWDGTGYPSKLKGIEIPISARIVAVADSFDSLASRLTYARKYDFNSVFDSIVSASGIQFDPEVIEAFIAAKVEIKNLYDQMGMDTDF